MPAFGDELLANCVWEWKPYYLNYDRLKGWIKELDSDSSEKAYSMFQEDLKASLHRVDRFYHNQEQLILEKVRSFSQEGREEPEGADEQNQGRKLVQTMDKLQQFAKQNVAGFSKITKKLDKNIKSLSEAGVLDFEARPLREYVVQEVAKFDFANAEDRLRCHREAVEAWEAGKEVEVSAFASMSQRMSLGNRGRVMSGLSSKGMGDLDTPFMDTRQQGGTARRLRAKTTNKLVIMAKNATPAVVISIATVALFCVDALPLDRAGYIVVWVTALVLLMLVQQKSPDVVLMGATLFLTVVGIITPKHAWAAFSNDVVLSVAGLGVVANAVESTGVIDLVFKVFLGKPTNLSVAMIRLFLPAVVLNVCISNTCVMSCLLPVIDRWAVQIGFHKAYFLMPLSYILLISGTFAIFSTSTNLIAQGLLVTHHKPPFGMFDLAIPALACTGVAILYLVIVTPILLSRFAVSKEAEAGSTPTSGRPKPMRQTVATYDIRIQIIGRAMEKRLEETDLMKAISGRTSDIITLERYGQHTSPVPGHMVLRRDDVIWMRTSLESIAALFGTAGVSFLALDLADDCATLDLSSRDLVEAILDQGSPLVSHQIGHARKYQPEHECPIVAYRAFHGDQGDPADLEVGATAQTRLQPGDHIILNTPTTWYKANKDSSDYVVLRKVCSGADQKEDNGHSDKAVVSGCCLLVLILLVSTSTLPLLEGVFVALALLISTKCTTVDQCVKAVKLRTVLTIVGAFGLGKAIGEEKVAAMLAHALVSALQPFGPRGLLVAIFVATVALGIIFHGTAVVVLMFPICLDVAESMNMPLHQVVAVLCLAVACQMLSPISYQTNLMAYSTGSYQFADFTKVGMGAVIAIMCVTIPICEIYFPV